MFKANRNLLLSLLQDRYGLGLHDLSEGDFDLRSLYNFRERLSCYNLEHGVNLLDQAFEKITDKQISTLLVRFCGSICLSDQG